MPHIMPPMNAQDLPLPAGEPFAHQPAGTKGETQEAGFPLYLDGKSFCFFCPTGQGGLKWEIPIKPLRNLARSMETVALTEIGQNSRMLYAVLALLNEISIPRDDLERMIDGLYADHTDHRLWLQHVLKQRPYECTALIDPETLSILSAIFQKPANFRATIEAVFKQLELLSAYPDVPDEDDVDFGLVDPDRAHRDMDRKLDAIYTILVHYFYLIQIAYYSINRAFRLRPKEGFKGSFACGVHASNNPILVRPYLPVFGYSAIYQELMHVGDTIDRLVRQHVACQRRFKPLLKVIEMFQIAAYMEMYFLGKTVDWKPTALRLEQNGMSVGRDMALVFRLLGLDEFEQRVLSSKKADRWMWEQYHVHVFLVGRVEPGLHL